MLARFLHRRPSPRRTAVRPRVDGLERREMPAVFNIGNGDVAGFIAAINTCNTNNQADTINLATNGTYTFTAVADSTDGGDALPVISADPPGFNPVASNTITINGNGATLTRPATAPQFRFFEVTEGFFVSGNLTLNNLTLTGGYAHGDGGALYLTGGTATLNNCTLTNNQADGDGGAVATFASSNNTLTFNQCTVSNNSTTGTVSSGGALNNHGTTTVVINNSTFDHNTTAFNGGAIWNQGDPLYITDSTISNNNATNSVGGGGAIFTQGDLTLTDSTLTSNRAGNGGGIDFASGTAKILNSTVVNNSAYFGLATGAGLEAGGTEVDLANSVIAGNTFEATATNPVGPDIYTPNGFSITSMGYNFIGNGTGGVLGGTLTGNLVGTAGNVLNPKLGGLTNNGGPTLTLLPQSGSPLVDAGDPNYTAPSPGFDQRGTGFPRVQGGRVDIGAVETFATGTPDLAITVTDNTATATPGTTTTYKVVVRNAGTVAVSGATVADALPAGVTAFTWQTATAGGATAPAGGSGAISATVGLPVGGSVTFTVVATIAATATGSLIETATVATPGGVLDANPSNNTATDVDTLIAAGQVDLGVTVTDGVSTATPGATTTYTIVVTNTSTTPVTGATVVDTLPTAITSATWTAFAANGATAPTSGTGSINVPVNLPANSSVTFTLVAFINPAATGSLADTATVATPTGVTDANAANNSATDTDTLGPPATPTSDVLVVLSDNGTAVAAGGTTTYVVTVRNAGPSPVSGVVLNDPLPAGVTGATWTALAAGGAGGNASAGAGAIKDTVNLPAGGSVTYTLVATIDAAATGYVVNAATVTVPPGVTDPNPFNNSATDTDAVVVPGPVYAVGTGAGVPGQVTVYDAKTGQQRTTFLPFGVNFTGGVHVATGDFNGDGVPDIVCAPASGLAPVVLVFDGVTNKYLFGFYAYLPSFTGGVNVAVGDVTGDGVPDIVTGQGPGAGPRVRAFDGRTGLPVAGPLGSFFAYAPQFKGGVQVAVGDVDGDKRADIITGAGPGGSPHVEVFSGMSGAMIRSFLAFTPKVTQGVTVAAGDVNGDGHADIIVGAGAGYLPQVQVYSGADSSLLQSFNAFVPAFHGGVRVASLDIDSDGQADILIGAGVGAGPRVRIVKGTDLSAIRESFAFDPSFLGGVYVG